MLGYNYKRELSRLASRLTIACNREIDLFFFGEHKRDNGDELEAIEFFDDSQTLTLEILKKMIADLKCIYIDQDKMNGGVGKHEYILLIAKDPETVQRYFDSLREGKISGKVCEKFNYFRGEHKDVSPEEIEAYSDSIMDDFPAYIVEELEEIGA